MYYQLFVTISIIFIILILLELINRNFKEYKAAILLNGSKIYPLIGNVLDIINKNAESSFSLLRSMAKKYDGNFRFYLYGKLYYCIYSAELCQIILSSPQYSNKGFTYRFMKQFTGNGLLNKNFDGYPQRRKILTPAFHFTVLNDFLPIFNEQSLRLIQRLKLNNGISNDVLSEMASVTLNTICETSMGIKLESFKNADLYLHAVHNIGEHYCKRVLSPLRFPDLINKLLGYERQLNKIIKPIKTFTNDIIQNHKKNYYSNNNERLNIPNDQIKLNGNKKLHSILDTLFMARSNGYEINDTEIGDEVATFIFGGYDTISAALTYTLLAIANYPEIQQKLYDHINEIIDSDSNNNDNNNEQLLLSFNLSHLNLMKYLECIIKESLRLYPPAPTIGRCLSENLIIKKNQIVSIPKGTEIQLLLFDLHRDHHNFPNPLKFDPDRFLPEMVANRHPYAFIPFSGGLRNCIGQKFAMLELKTIIAHIILNFQLEPITKIDELVFVTDMILRTKDPVKIRFIPRCK